ncbi:hypothetical protein CRENBAI_023338 [Crenichthys baileyi]|uniref:Uncharacterized protein n=1 Tax=Crenichthys baileyi TaxID=28760 RepID=A0AAV9SGV2_9TELE
MATHSPCQPRPCSLWALSTEESPGGQRVDARQPPRHGAVRPLPLAAPKQSGCHILVHPSNPKYSPKHKYPNLFMRNTSNFFSSIISELEIQNNPKRGQQQKDVEKRENVFVIRVIHSPQLLECPYYSRCTLDEPISRVQHPRLVGWRTERHHGYRPQGFPAARLHPLSSHSSVIDTPD